LKSKGDTPEEKRQEKSLELILFNCAYIYFLANNVQSSAGLLEQMIKNNEDHVDALFLYSKLSTLCSKHDNALSLLLRCVVKRQDDKEIKANLAHAIAREGGMALLAEQLPLTASGAPAYAFIATILKDVGYIELATALLTY
jgi:tetratricopeptide (TPR) repeat protein